MKIRNLIIVVAGFICLQTSLHAQSLLWKITGNGLEEPSYLFGTIHIQDKRVFQFNEELPKVMESVDQLGLELKMDQETMSQLMEALVLDDGKMLDDVLSEELLETLEKLVEEELGEEMSQYENMSPFAPIMTLMQDKFAKDMPVAVDIFLQQQAEAMGKEVIGIESAEEQIKVMKLLATPEMIKKFVDDFDKMDEQVEHLIKNYREADLDEIHAMITEEYDEYDEYIKVMFDDRNNIMAERIQKVIHEKSMLAAVGAGHLSGETGLIAQFRNAGYTVEPVIAEKKEWPAIEVEAVWQLVKVQDFYSVDMPGEPKYEHQRQSVDDLEYDLHNYLYTDVSAMGENLVYGASLMVYHTDEDLWGKSAESLKETYDESQRSTARLISGEVLEQTDMEILGYPGRQFKMIAMGGVMQITAQMVMIGNRMILLQTIYQPGKVSTEEEMQYFQSLKLQKD